MRIQAAIFVLVFVNFAAAAMYSLLVVAHYCSGWAFWSLSVMAAVYVITLIDMAGDAYMKKRRRSKRRRRRKQA